MEGAAGQQQKDQEQQQQQQQSCGRQVAEEQQHAPQQRPQEQSVGSPAEQPAGAQAGMAAAAPAGSAPPAGPAALQQDEVAMELKGSADLEAEVALMLSGMNKSVMEGPAPTESAGAARCCCCGLPAAAHLLAVLVAVCECQIANPLEQPCILWLGSTAARLLWSRSRWPPCIRPHATTLHAHANPLRPCFQRHLALERRAAMRSRRQGRTTCRCCRTGCATEVSSLSRST